MGEAWDDLAVSRAQRAQGADDVAQITTLCARDHPQHKHVLECRECYGKVIDRMSRRYLGSKDRTSQPEWFSGRDALLKDLEELFVATREYKADLNEVDVRLDEERRRWYGQRAKASPSIRKSLEDFLNERDVFAAIGLDGVTFEDNVGEVREALGRSNVLNGEATADGAERAVERLIGAKLPEERVQVYKEMFFQGKPDEEMSGRTQMYLESFRSGATMDEIITKIVVDRRSSIGALEQKERHRQRVEELRRARAAHELQKSKKASGRKDSNHSNQRPQPPDEMYDQPPCHACGGELDLRDYLACPLCQVLVDNGVRTKAIVFCSAACFSGHHGQEAHVEAAHDCTSRDSCVQLTDEDVDMDMDGSGPFLCRECILDLKKEAVYCSVRCAHVNFRRHREEVHLPERKHRALDVHKDADELAFEDGDRARYHPRDIRSHLIPMADLLVEFQQRNAIEVAETVYPD